METKSVRVSGIQTPAYLNGRSREMLIEAFQPKATVVAEAPTSFVTAMHISGIKPDDGVPFAAIDMTRAKKKFALHPTAA
jgi:hypothetical protein